MDLGEDRLDVVAEAPARVVALELADVGDPPAVVADARSVGELEAQLAPCDPLAGLDRLEHRAVGVPPAAHVVDGGLARGALELDDRLDEVGRVDVVADLLAAVAEDRVALARDGALHQVGEEAVKLRAGVVWAGQAAAAKAHRRDL